MVVASCSAQLWKRFALAVRVWLLLCVALPSLAFGMSHASTRSPPSEAHDAAERNPAADPRAANLGDSHDLTEETEEEDERGSHSESLLAADFDWSCSDRQGRLTSGPQAVAPKLVEHRGQLHNRGPPST